MLITQMFWMLLNGTFTASKLSLSQTDQRDVLFHMTWHSVIESAAKRTIDTILSLNIGEDEKYLLISKMEISKKFSDNM